MIKIDTKTADEYFSTRLGSEAWFDLDDTKKQAAITTAYEKIKQLPFIGTKVVQTQDDIFPRFYNGYVIEMPSEVAKGIFEEALNLVIIDTQGFTNIPEGLQSVGLGGASMTFSGALTSNSVSAKTVSFLDSWLRKGFDIDNAKYREVY